MRISVVSRRKRTEPSQNQKKAPPGCRLPNDSANVADSAVSSSSASVSMLNPSLNVVDRTYAGPSAHLPGMLLSTILEKGSTAISVGDDHLNARSPPPNVFESPSTIWAGPIDEFLPKTPSYVSRHFRQVGRTVPMLIT